MAPVARRSTSLRVVAFSVPVSSTSAMPACVPGFGAARVVDAVTTVSPPKGQPASIRMLPCFQSPRQETSHKNFRIDLRRRRVTPLDSGAKAQDAGTERVSMDFEPSPKATELAERLTEFLFSRVIPAEQEYDAQRAAAGPDDHTVPPIVEQLK